MGNKEKRDQLILRQQEMVMNAKAQGRELTADEQTEFDTAQREIETIQLKINEDERQAGALLGEERGAEQERKRISEIMSLCREFGLDEQKYISEKSSVEQVKDAVIAYAKNQNAPLGAKGIADIQVGVDGEDKFRSAVADALVMRGGVDISKPNEGSRELMGMSLRDLAIETMGRDANISGLNRKSSDELYEMLCRQFYNPSAAFPSIMDQAINKAYIEGHKTVSVTFDRWTKKGSLKDFKTHDNNYLAGPAGEFLEVPEGGELKHDLPTDEKRPTRKLKTYGRQFSMTRQAFINDDIDFLSTTPAKYAKSARKTINKQCYQILVNNPAVYDGIPLFASSHKNILATGTGVTKMAMQTMIMALQTQEDEFGEAAIINPATIIVPSGYAFDMYTLFYSPMINSEGNTQAVNPLYRYKDQIDVVEDPTINVLSGGFGNVMPWWLIGSKDDTDFMEVDYLNGQEVPNIRRMEVAGTLGYVWDIYLDWGISVMDWRGAIKNPGITVKNPLELA